MCLNFNFGQFNFGEPLLCYIINWRWLGHIVSPIALGHCANGVMVISHPPGAPSSSEFSFGQGSLLLLRPRRR